MSRRRSLAFVLALAAPATLAQGLLQVSGDVRLRPPGAPPADARLILQVRDSSRADAPAVVLSEQQIALNGARGPIPFALSIDPDMLRPGAQVTVGARIQRGRQVLFIHDGITPALTNGQPDHVDLLLVPVPAPRSRR